MPEETKTALPRLIRVKDFRTIYSNSFRIRVGDNDIGMTFSYQTQTPSDAVLVQDEAEVVVTPRQLKFMSQMLLRVVEDVEVAIGEVVLPDLMIEQLAGLDEERKKRRGTK